MKLKTDNPIPVKTRLKELLGDWLFISFSLIALFLLAMGFYTLILGGLPAFTEAQSQLKAVLASVGQVYSWFTNIGAFPTAFCALLSSFSLGSWDTWELSVVPIKQMLCQFSCQLQQGFSS